MPEENNLWAEVGNKCLRKASELLDGETATTEGTVEAVKKLVETAISIDMLNLQWFAQSRCGAAAFSGQTFQQRAKGN